MLGKHYLLKFDDNWADEHSIPALACFTQQEYDKWLAFDFRKDNPEYEKQYPEWEKSYKRYTEYIKGLRDRNLYSKLRNTFTNEEEAWVTENEVHYVSTSTAPSIGRSKLRANLGNNGEGFEESYSLYKYGQDFITRGIVSVTEVDSSFYETFHKAQLAGISLCNIFDMESIEYDDDDYTDD